MSDPLTHLRQRWRLYGMVSALMIALALVVFAAWRPWRTLAGAYLFGGLAVLQLYLQGSGLVVVPTQFLTMLPYVATVVVLTIMSSGPMRKRLAAPACLGRPFRPVS